MKKVVFSLYLLLIILFDISSYLFIDPNFTYLKQFYTGFAFTNRSVTSLIYLLCIVAFFSFYVYFIKLAVQNNLSKKEALFLIGATGIGLLFSYPAIVSYDIFYYVAISKVLFFYHENPYIFTPIEFLKDPNFIFVRSGNQIAFYGPAWIISSGIPYFLGFKNYLLTLLNFKIFISVFYFLTSFLVFKLSKNLKSLVLFSLNPLIFIESLVSGHNDIFMICLALLSFYFIKNKIVSFVCYLLSIFAKLSTILLLPIYILIFVQKKLRAKVFFYSAILMFLIFLLSPLRQEMYPWYAVWFLPFLYIAQNEGALIWLSGFLSFGLMLSYLPYMYLNIYSNLMVTGLILGSLFVGLILLIFRKIMIKENLR